MENDKPEFSIKIMQIRAFCMIADYGTISEASINLFRT